MDDQQTFFCQKKSVFFTTFRRVRGMKRGKEMSYRARESLIKREKGMGKAGNGEEKS